MIFFFWGSAKAGGTVVDFNEAVAVRVAAAFNEAVVAAVAVEGSKLSRSLQNSWTRSWTTIMLMQ